MHFYDRIWSCTETELRILFIPAEMKCPGTPMVLLWSHFIPTEGLSNRQVNLPPKQGYSELRCYNPTSFPQRDCPTGRSTFHQNRDTQNSGVIILLHSTEGLSNRQVNLPPKQGYSELRCCCDSTSFPLRDCQPGRSTFTPKQSYSEQMLLWFHFIPTEGLSNRQVNLPPKQGYSELRCCCNPTSFPLRDCPTDRSTFHQNKVTQNSGVVVIPFHSHWGTV